ncbi:hypothetical protein CCZ37_16940 [Vibrio qinghaiensis]|uniref:Permuted papain-like amidase YaeF/Yiix C92 family enzyme n=1 Tax=Vibrio qinghaiensis TaxID=2025808 RepID=A0A223N3E0_9VIBR|nr:hypothetical protein [Vibrio qinghaiensis]ASU24173.1 hypothetical protein CCZ37_16940 [Vibrio qinghaiensis]
MVWTVIKNSFFNAMDAWELRAGDVLICHKKTKFSLVRAAIKGFTASEYTHAAIALGQGKILDAVKPKVRISKGIDFFDEYDHVAVFRRNDFWDKGRQAQLNLYANKLVEESREYSAIGAVKAYTERNKEQSPKLHKFMQYLEESNTNDKEQFFCSQLVVQCFIEVGIIDQEAGEYSTFLNPKLVYPVDLSKDSVFGYHYKYIKFKYEYDVPDDEFTTIDKYKDIYK